MKKIFLSILGLGILATTIFAAQMNHNNMQAGMMEGMTKEECMKMHKEMMKSSSSIKKTNYDKLLEDLNTQSITEG
ncbi:hypothetical protein CRU99_03955 [Malaciobacter mytili]|uniref:DUF1104 domain-containing protein n=1 Tax=Malaciobacter mytili LMG 24559 TaxID=1032238 RepID=A0AAX2AJH3_9BACT|nr:hypothetical protein [Malaciobacter mytili]AXH13716.1 hypothetical protein AMYT_0090 [Malaciobacter mytili LMG 24559]RXI45274.1 hypothetical protein CRU99_03955 [Malaciobacter mytili]RXK16326.1 hypothetical protein CP985_03995 [Malaciobacter mytili LMG 24559]